MDGLRERDSCKDFVVVMVVAMRTLVFDSSEGSLASYLESSVDS